MDSKLSPLKTESHSLSHVRGLRMDDIGAATKKNEVYGRTRIPIGPLQLPFPGNFLFLKYMPGIRRWGPYEELSPSTWERFISLFESRQIPLTIGVTASWVEDSGDLTSFPKKFPEQAKLLKAAAQRGVIEIANHGLTHCILDAGQYKPQLFSSNRKAHREFWDWVAPETHRENIKRSQAILQDYFGFRVTTFIPPGNVFQPYTVEFAKENGIRTISCKTPTRMENDMAFIGDQDLLPFHDREIALEGVAWADVRLTSLKGNDICFVRDLGSRLRTEGHLT